MAGPTDKNPMTQKITSKELLLALRNKFRDAAVLAEVTMDDEDELERVRTAYVKIYPHMKAGYEKEGVTCNAELPDGYRVNEAITRRRIDALIFETKTRTAVEIKISRADFFRDTEAKRGAWLRHTHRFAYLVPKGLVKTEEVPDGCGLWEYENGIITITKRAKINKEAKEFPASMTKYFAWRAFAAERRLESGRRR